MLQPDFSAMRSDTMMGLHVHKRLSGNTDKNYVRQVSNAMRRLQRKQTIGARKLLQPPQDGSNPTDLISASDNPTTSNRLIEVSDL